MAQSPPEPVVLLEGEFPLHSKGKQIYRLSISDRDVTFAPLSAGHSGGRHSPSGKRKTSSASKGCVLRLDDVIGCDVMRGKPGDVAAYFNIYAYPHKKNLIGKGTSRKRQASSFVFGKCESFEENLTEANRWRLTLAHLVRREFKTTDVNILQTIPVPERNLLVLVNPFSGPGKALHIFQRHVVPIFAEAGLKYQLIITEYAGHAREIAKNLKLEEWYGVIIVSGDGLVYEVVNGLMERPDWEKAIKMPIGALPGGSGNALSCALLYRVGEPYLENAVLHASFMIAKHDVAPMDLVAIDTGSGKRIYSFLSVGWGIISDVDIESERYRSLGNARFTVGAVVRIAALRKYRGRLSFLPVDPAYRSKVPNNHSKSSKHRSHEPTCCTSASSVNPSISSPSGECLMNAASSPSSECSKTVVPSMSDAAGGSVKIVGGSDADGYQEQPHDVPEGAEGLHPGTKPNNLATPLLSPLGEPVPDDWVTIEDEFIMVIALYQTHIAQDMIAAPDSRLDDGVIYLSFTRGETTRLKMVKLFTNLQDGKPPPEGDSSTEIIRVRAFRLEPLTEKGIMTVDGEVVDYGPIQGQVLPSIARIMTLTKDMHGS